MSLTTSIVLSAPFVCLALAMYFLRAKSVKFSSLILGFGFSCWAIVFYFIRLTGAWYGGADIGSGIIVMYSPALTIPMALLGVYLGKSFSFRKSLLMSVVLIFVWMYLSLLYNQSIEIKEKENKQKSIVDCDSMPYHCAIEEGRLTDLSIIKSQGISTESKDGWGRTALIFYIQKYNVVKTLLELGANPNSIDSNGNTALSLVLTETNKPNFRIAELLISNGADINEMYGRGSEKKMTVLNSAISKKQENVIYFMLEQGADPTIRDDYGYTACERAKIYQISGFELLDRICRP